MTEEKYNTKDIKHIDEKNQEYIAEGNRMTKEIIIDGVNVSGCSLFYNAYNENMCARVDGLTCREDDNCYYKQLKRLEQENKELKEKIIKLTEENGNLIINRNTVENKLRDTESRLISIQKANTHNLVLLQRRNNALEEISRLASPHCTQCSQIINIINECIGD